jgi:lipoprotein-anchoring transpeptidase ErfK/SrfK
MPTIGPTGSTTPLRALRALRGEVVSVRRGHAAYARELVAAAAAVLVIASGTPAEASAAQQTPSLYRPGVTTYYAFVERPVVVRSRPAAAAKTVARLGTLTADGTSMLVEVLRAGNDGSGSPWLQVHMPVLPNSIVGWLPRAAVGPLVAVHTWLIVDTEHLRATLVSGGRVVFSARVGVGKASTPTPHGSFYVIDRLVTGGEGGVYGPMAFGTSAKSAVLTDWPGGGVVGIHGTDEPRLIPGRLSHGCIRMNNRDIERLGRLMPVGTPVTIE